MTVRVTSCKLCIPLSVFLVLRIPLFVTCSKVLHTGLRVSVRSQCGSSLNVDCSTNSSSRGSTGCMTECALCCCDWVSIVLLFYNASAFRSDAYLRNCLLGGFLDSKCSDEHICFVTYFIIEVKDVW